MEHITQPYDLPSFHVIKRCCAQVNSFASHSRIMRAAQFYYGPKPIWNFVLK